MQCRKCGADVPSANVNIQMAIAKCDACNAVFSFRDELAPELFDGAEAQTELRRPSSGNVPLPKNLNVENTGAELRFKKRFFTPAVFFLTFFALFWDGFMIVWFAIAFSTREYMMAAFGSLHGLIGLGISYNVLAMYLNSRHIAVNREHLIAWSGPLPWPGSRTLDSNTVSQIWCRRGRSSRRSSSINSVSMGGSFEVWALMRDGAEQRLMAGLDKPEQALYIEQEIERYLHISDRPVHAKAVL
jgi:hypothetical protein